MAGNVGTAVASLVGSLDPAATVVCETSSSSSRTARRSPPRPPCFLNVTEDHLDRHGTLEAYLAAKLRVFARQGNDDVAVYPCGVGIEDLGGCARRSGSAPSPRRDLPTAPASCGGAASR